MKKKLIFKLFFFFICLGYAQEDVNLKMLEGIERIRTKSKAHDRVLELVTEKVKGKTGIRIATLHANASDDAQKLLDRASKQLSAVESLFTEVSPVVGTHAGPGTVGLAYIHD